MWTWIAVGCGGFILLGVVGTCVGPGIFAMMFMDGLAGMGPVAPAMPPGAIAPGTAGLELPPAPGPLTPIGASTVVASGRRSYSLQVTEATEVEGVSVGDSCEFDVERLPRGGGSYWCRTEVSCGEVALYGGPGQGYFDCTFPESEYDHLQAYDYSMRDDDGDASFTIDYDGNLAIRDHIDGTTTVVSGTIQEIPTRIGAPTTGVLPPALEL